MKKQSQKGFAHLEALLLVVLAVIIGFTLWYVWHSNRQANKSLAGASSTNLANPSSIKTFDQCKKAKGSKMLQTYPEVCVTKDGRRFTNPAQKITSPNLINYTASNANGVTVSSDNDIDKLDGASDSLKKFLKDDIHKHAHRPCGNAYGLFVKKIFNDKLALGGILGGETDCKNTNKLWAQVSQQWQEIGSTTDNFDCSILEQYKVPPSIVDHCMKNGQLVNNAVEE